ncbi:MAG: 1-acyl-sn-glycerol-3-phosphate acyltransferase [Lewinellaceae bacterium]|nr:1-acyl-sn-glycerol-3-phosphate acyltransferase [Saprospiraceae bacterium]MCB9330389.1 1-acyl-sn-glycerol-3-phosphate acyltransferase [Lewinellaceae bacterium]
MSFFRKIWAIYAVLLFLLMMFISMIVLLVNMALSPGERALRRNIYYLHHVFTPTFLALVGIRVKVEGAEKIQSGQSYVIVGNHNSALDFIVNADAFPGVFRFLAKQELHKVPVFGWVVKKMCLAVDRSSAMSRARSVVMLKQQLAAGWSIFIYPEGGRNRTDEPLAPFYDGAFRIAIQTKAPIAIQTIVNIRAISATAKSIDLRPGTVRIAWDAPIETAHLESSDIPALKEQVRQIMLNHLKSA